jgi:TonB C terminal
VAASKHSAAATQRERPANNLHYQVHARPEAERPLRGAEADFAAYLQLIHGRLHARFSLESLPRLERVPCGEPVNDYELSVALELVLSAADGQLRELGIVRTSGVDAFDELALEAVLGAAPFGKPSATIVSNDGNVYVHWELHRNPLFACSTYFARPYLL